MKDCKLVITVTDDVVSIEGRDISVEEIATLTGFLQIFAGTEGLKRGLSLDDVKDTMLDIYLFAMETLEEQLRAGDIVRGRGEHDSEEEA